MKKATLITMLLLLSFSINAQRNIEIVKYEVETRLGGLLFGIAETKDGADAVMLDFQKRNKGSKYDISDHPVKYKFTTVPVKSFDNAHNPVTKFKYYAGKAYKVLSAEDIKGVDIAKRKGIDAGVDYYVEVRGAERGFVEDRLKNILIHLDEFRIKPPQDRYLAVSSD